MVDEIIQNANGNNRYDKEAYKKKKQEQLKEAYKLIDNAINKVKEDKEFFKTYLDIQSNFSNYSMRNALLVSIQNPNATHLKDYYSWKEQKAIFINKSPKKVLLLEPRENNKKENRKMYYNAKEVIDISETNLKPQGKNYDSKLVLQALLNTSATDIKAVDNLDNDKICSWDKENKILNVKRTDNIDTLIKELATETANIISEEKGYTHNEELCNCVGYMISHKYKFNTSNENINETHQKLNSMNQEEIKEQLEMIRDIASEINDRMELYIYKNMEIKEKNKELER